MICQLYFLNIKKPLYLLLTFIAIISLVNFFAFFSYLNEQKRVQSYINSWKAAEMLFDE